MCLLHPFQKIQECVASIKSNLSHREFERCRGDLEDRLHECLQFESVAEEQLATTRKRLLVLSRALALARSNGVTPLRGVISNYDAETVAVRFRQMTAKRSADEHSLQRATGRSGAVRRQLLVLEEAADNAQVMCAIDRVSRYTEVAGHSEVDHSEVETLTARVVDHSEVETLTAQVVDHSEMEEMTVTLVAACTGDDEVTYPPEGNPAEQIRQGRDSKVHQELHLPDVPRWAPTYTQPEERLPVATQ